MSRDVQQRILGVISSIALAVAYVSIGFAVCAGLPLSTQVLSSINSDFEGSPYTRSDLMELALETRAYTVDVSAGSEEDSLQADDELSAKVLSCANSSMDSDLKASQWTEPAREMVSRYNDGAISSMDAMVGLYGIDPSYGMDGQTLEHLEDVRGVITVLRNPLFGIATIATFTLMGLFMMFGIKPTARTLKVGGTLALGILVILGLWGLVSFDTLFAGLHGLLFAEGSWVFPAQSLLIEMYPEGFWMGMALLWASISALVSLVSILIGRLMFKRNVTAKADGDIGTVPMSPKESDGDIGTVPMSPNGPEDGSR